ncbi:MAG: alpha/beta hydrolase [Thermoplasmatota archaeon]
MFAQHALHEAGSNPAAFVMFLDGPAGKLDVRVHGEGPGVLLLHPHPFHGGSMGTRFVHQLANALADAGYQAIRFNFRGVGRSEGSYDRGWGELEDALAVWDHLQPRFVVGFSFGGAIAMELATQRDPAGLVCISTPAKVRDSDLEPWRQAAEVTCPTAFVHGTDDDVVPREQMDALAAGLQPPPTWFHVEGGDHFLTPTHLDAAVAATLAAMKAVNADAPVA